MFGLNLILIGFRLFKTLLYTHQGHILETRGGLFRNESGTLDYLETRGGPKTKLVFSSLHVNLFLVVGSTKSAFVCYSRYGILSYCLNLSSLFLVNIFTGVITIYPRKRSYVSVFSVILIL